MFLKSSHYERIKKNLKTKKKKKFLQIIGSICRFGLCIHFYVFIIVTLNSLGDSEIFAAFPNLLCHLWYCLFQRLLVIL